MRNAVSEQGSKVIMILFKVIKIRFKPLISKHATKTHLKKFLVSHQEKHVPANYTGTRVPSVFTRNQKRTSRSASMEKKLK